MIGLLRKDLYMAWAYCKTFLLILAVFIAVGLSGEENSFFILYPMIIGMMLPVSLISYDERFKWHLCCDAMPVSRAMVVSSKYVLTLLTVLLVFVATMLAQWFRLTRMGNVERLWELPGLLLPIGLVGPAILMPVIFRLGVEKGRIKDVTFYGDFLATEPLEPVTEALRDCAFTKEAVGAILAGFRLQTAFGGITKEEILQTIFEDPQTGEN